MHNNVKTAVLMSGLLGLFLIVGQLIGGSSGLMLALVFALGFNCIMYFFSDRMVLKMYRAQVIAREDAPELYDMVDRLRQPNAFATGRNPEHAVVAVTSGILEAMAAGR